MLTSTFLTLVALATADTTVPAGALLVVTNKQEASASLIDPATGATVATVPTGEGPHEVAITRDGRRAIVADYGAQSPGGTLTVIDLERRVVEQTISLGVHRRPHGIVVLPGDERVAVTSETSRMVLIVHLDAGLVEQEIPTGEPGSHMVAVTADGRRGYTANIGSGSITELDMVGATARRTLPVAQRTEGVGVTPDGSQVWVGSNTEHTVTVVDVATWRAVDTLAAPGLPYRVSISADGRTAVVPTPMSDAIRVFDVATREERGTVTFSGGQPVGTVITPDGAYAFVSLQGSTEAAMVDLRTLREVRRFRTGAGPDGIAVRWAPPAGAD